VIEGTETLEEAGEGLLSLVVDIVSRTLTLGETVNYSDPTEIYTMDPPF